MAMQLTSLDDMIERDLGPIGTPERDEFEADVRNAIHSFHIGEAIKNARKSKNMTRDQLALLMGVKKSRVSQIERGDNPTLRTIARAFNALGIPISLNCGTQQFSLV